jgi:formylglycine-generating enzyme required for sulfatase activity
MATFIQQKQTHRIYSFNETLGGRIDLEMVLIPGGEFQMGAPETELDSQDNERPQHPVTVPTFFMGSTPVTQAQWRQVLRLALQSPGLISLTSDPSAFTGDDRPVENVSWDAAIEFCDWLSFATGRQYRLPSEAEWEYACRAGTPTPFHFGETIGTDIANYQGTDNETMGQSGSYGRGEKGLYRKETTPVKAFSANAFGLYDMHGNILEWCQDDYHDNYAKAPSNGTAWIDKKSNSKTLRGGAWISLPRYCRSAYRAHYFPSSRDNYIGFRVVCVPPPELLPPHDSSPPKLGG